MIRTDLISALRSSEPPPRLPMPSHRAGAAAESDPMPSHPPAELPADIAVSEWDDLFEAVKTRLRYTAGTVLAATLGPAPDAQDRVHCSVMECVSALDQLHVTLRREMARRDRLELELFDANTALAQLRAEFWGTRCGDAQARQPLPHDDLTSLPNRDDFCERAEQALALPEPGDQANALLYLDIDAFKSVVDSHGPDAGDELLKVVAARLTRSVRSGDTLGRVDVDEFACLMRGLPGREPAHQMARVLIDEMLAPVQIGQLYVTLRPSIGIAMLPPDGSSAQGLLEHAADAMYRAKLARSGYAFFDRRVA